MRVSPQRKSINGVWGTAEAPSSTLTRTTTTATTTTTTATTTTNGHQVVTFNGKKNLLSLL